MTLNRELQADFVLQSVKLATVSTLNMIIPLPTLPCLTILFRTVLHQVVRLVVAARVVVARARTATTVEADGSTTVHLETDRRDVRLVSDEHGVFAL